MGAMTYRITGVSIVYSRIYSGADKKTSEFRVTGRCEGKSPMTGEIPAQRPVTRLSKRSVLFKKFECSIDAVYMQFIRMFESHFKVQNFVRTG